MSKYLPLENVYEILKNASTLEEYKNIRESFNLKDSDIENLIKREYNKKIDKIKDVEKMMNNKYKDSKITHLFKLMNPEPRYMLVYLYWDESEVSKATQGTKKEILSYLEATTRTTVFSLVTDEEIDKDMASYAITQSISDYNTAVEDAVASIDKYGYSNTIGKFEFINAGIDEKDFYLLVKL